MSSIMPPKLKAPPAPLSDAASTAASSGPKAPAQKKPAGGDEFEASQTADAQFKQSIESEILPDTKGEQSAKNNAKGGHGKKTKDPIDPNDPSMLPLITNKP